MGGVVTDCIRCGGTGVLHAVTVNVRPDGTMWAMEDSVPVRCRCQPPPEPVTEAMLWAAVRGAGLLPGR